MPTTQSSEAFQVIQDYHQLELSHLLKEIIQEQELSIPELYRKLQGQDYYLSLESLYRYFSSSPKSNRFPPQDFIVAFSEALQLTGEQAQLLNQFWRHYKLLKRRDVIAIAKKFHYPILPLFWIMPASYFALDW